MSSKLLICGVDSPMLVRIQSAKQCALLLKRLEVKNKAMEGGIRLFVDVKGYEGYYQISEKGEVISLDRFQLNSLGRSVIRRGRTLKPFVNTSGYQQIGLSLNGATRKFYVHKLVAEHFISNPFCKEEVNHIDHNKLNNDVSNLEWCTRKENMLAMREFYQIGLSNFSEIFFCCQCGKSFPAKGKGKFCSQKCSQESQRVVSKILFCEHCGKSFEPADAKKFCSQTCFKQSSRRTDRPSAEDLVVEIKALGFCGVGRKYGVSDNAIRKWCKNYGLPTNSKSYK